MWRVSYALALLVAAALPAEAGDREPRLRGYGDPRLALVESWSLADAQGRLDLESAWHTDPARWGGRDPSLPNPVYSGAPELMAIVRSFGAFQSVESPFWNRGVSEGSLSLYSASPQTYAAIYRTQPYVRTVVDMVAMSVAQLGWPVYRRVSDTDRVRLSDHELSQWLERPNPGTTRYRLFESLMGDLGIYANAYWVKIRTDNAPLGLARLHPAQMSVEGQIFPTGFVWTKPNGQEIRFAPSEIVYFNGYNPDPDNPVMGLSLLETLRRVLAEEHAASVYREAFWSNGARMSQVITRPKDAPKWTPMQRDSWREQWQSAYGAGGSRIGATAVLEDGMDVKNVTQSAKDAEYLAARKLTREEVASAFQVPLPFVGILDHATFSNIKEQHKHLYQDCLLPRLVMIAKEIERQLLIECKDQESVYIEANISAKLAGSFEESATSIQMAVGKPWMTVNEARARQNLPAHEDPEADQIAPQQGGPATSADRPAEPSEEERAESVATVIQAAQARQRAKLAKVDESERAAAFAADFPRWTRELTADLTPILGEDEAQRVAAGVNAQTYQQLAEALYV